MRKFGRVAATLLVGAGLAVGTASVAGADVLIQPPAVEPTYGCFTFNCMYPGYRYYAPPPVYPTVPIYPTVPTYPVPTVPTYPVPTAPVYPTVPTYPVPLVPEVVPLYPMYDVVPSDVD